LYKVQLKTGLNNLMPLLKKKQKIRGNIFSKMIL